MKKLNKKQLTAVEYLVIDIDELDNKPRRLFQALRGIAEAFLENKTLNDKEHKAEVIDSINQFEESYYLYLNTPEIMKSVGQASHEVKRELTSEKATMYDDDKDNSGYVWGVKKACNLMAKKIISEMADFNDN